MAGLEGQTLGRYELQRLIGRGGMADVYEGYDPHFDRQVAVKVFKREDEEMLRRFIKEAQLMAKLHNPHLLRIYDTDESQIGNDTRYYIVMPFMGGGTLRARIRRSPLSLTEACRYLRDIADALDYIHSEGIVHRDIKASNVLLDAEGHCYLSDFGIARISTDATQLTSTGNVLGTVDYVAPELFEVNRRADARSDLYSLGVLLFEMVTGQLPFAAENQIALVAMHMHKRPPSPRSISPEVSPQVERVVFKALEKKPEQRYSSATELAEAFCRAVALSNTSNNGAIVGGGDTSNQKLPGVAGPDKLVLPPVRTAVPGASRLRPAPLSSSTETAPFVAPFSAAPPVPPVPPPAPVQPRESRRSPVPPTRRRSQGPGYRFWTPVIVALLCIALIGVGIYAAIHSANTGNNTTGATSTRTGGATAGTTSTPTATATPNLTATAQAVAAVTATAHAQATASAIAHATATVRAQASATAGVIQTATAGKPVYQDALNDSGNADTQAAQWDGLDGNNSHCVFQSDGYHVREGILIRFRGCHEAGNTYKNATISVDVDILKGHSGGLFFRISADAFGNYSGYLFEIDSQGNYKISVVTGGNTTALQGHDWTQSSALKTGNNVKNTLQVIVHDDTFLFYANGTFLTQVMDTTYVTEGDIGFLATATTTSADVVYSNLKVYSLP